jgi:NAD(P)-dependent dehydrogenase (short-subunit alcohol dehydrogenase family)
MLGEGADAVSHVLDVSSAEGWNAWAADILARRGHVDIVINNAGVTPAASAKDQTHDDFAWPMSINFWGVVYGT